MSDFVEVRERVWVARHAWFDLNLGVVGGRRGAVVVDTHASERAAHEVLASVHSLGAGRVIAVINTHEHFDHVFGNAVFRDHDPDVPLHAHHVACARTVEAGEQAKAAYTRKPDDPHRDEVLATRIVPADHPFDASATIDLGDRAVELRHLGRGHTGGDAVVFVPDVDVALVGDLVEEGAPPALGSDSFPLDWPSTSAALLERLTGGTVVVPGHGAIVDRAFVECQGGELAVVAATIRRLANERIPMADAFHHAQWPWEREHLTYAVPRGYEQLGHFP